MILLPRIWEAMVILHSVTLVFLGNRSGSGGVPTCYSENFFYAGIQGES